MIRRPFNLLKPISPPLTLWDKIYDWVLFRARVIVLIAIILITIVFVGKVIVDTDAKNKNKEIASIKAKLSVLEEGYEQEFLDVFRRQKTYTSIWPNSSSYTGIIQEINSYLTNEVNLNIKIQTDKVTIFGTEELSVLSQVEIAMKSSPSFKNVFINSLTVDSGQAGLNQGDYILTAEIVSNKREEI